MEETIFSFLLAIDTSRPKDRCNFSLFSLCSCKLQITGCALDVSAGMKDPPFRQHQCREPAVDIHSCIAVPGTHTTPQCMFPSHELLAGKLVYLKVKVVSWHRVFFLNIPLFLNPWLIVGYIMLHAWKYEYIYKIPERRIRLMFVEKHVGTLNS